MHNIAQRYNGGGDLNYSAKLDYLIKDVFPKIQCSKGAVAGAEKRR